MQLVEGPFEGNLYSFFPFLLPDLPQNIFLMRDDDQQEEARRERRAQTISHMPGKSSTIHSNPKAITLYVNDKRPAVTQFASLLIIFVTVHPRYIQPLFDFENWIDWLLLRNEISWTFCVKIWPMKATLTCVDCIFVFCKTPSPQHHPRAEVLRGKNVSLRIELIIKVVPTINILNSRARCWPKLKINIVAESLLETINHSYVRLEKFRKVFKKSIIGRRKKEWSHVTHFKHQL